MKKFRRAFEKTPADPAPPTGLRCASVTVKLPSPMCISPTLSTGATYHSPPALPLPGMAMQCDGDSPPGVRGIARFGGGVAWGLQIVPPCTKLHRHLQRHLRSAASAAIVVILTPPRPQRLSPRSPQRPNNKCHSLLRSPAPQPRQEFHPALDPPNPPEFALVAVER